MKKKVLIFLLFVVSVFSFNSIDNILSFKFSDGIVPVRNLYKHKNNSIDVLILGSSHAFIDVNTQFLFDEYGIASYVLAGSIQPFWNSYFYLQESLKTQKPKLILIEGFLSTVDFNHSDHSRIIKNNFGLKNSLLNMKSLLVSSPKNKRDDYFFRNRLYHSRYNGLKASDRKDFYEKGIYRNNKGFLTSFKIQKFSRPASSVTEDAEILPMNKKQEKYFLKIVELCKKEKIPLFVFVSPFLLNQNDQKKFNYLEQLSKNLSLNFINYNRSEMYDKVGLDFSTDFLDNSHLNYQGSIKYSKALGAYIKERFSVPDRRGDKEYETWAISSEILKNIPINKAVTDAKDPDDYIKSIKENKNIRLYVNTLTSTREIAEKGFFEKLDINGDYLKDGRLYEFEKGSLTEISDNKINWKIVVPLFDEKIIFQQKKSFSDKTTVFNSLFYNGKEYINDKTGTYVVAYDTLSREVVAVRQIVCKKNGNDCALTLVKK